MKASQRDIPDAAVFANLSPATDKTKLIGNKMKRGQPEISGGDHRQRKRIVP